MIHIELAKAGSNPDQRPTAVISAPNDGAVPLVAGDIFHVQGQPEDVKWRVVAIHRNA